MKRITPLLMSLCAGLLAAQAALAAPIRNADVIKLIAAGMPDEVVLQAIANGEPKFDTSADALIALKAKGASPAVLKAMLSPAAGAKKSAGHSAAPAAASGYNPEEVTLLVNGAPSIMQYTIPQMRTAARALGFGGVASYASLNGPAAQRRLDTGSPSFIVSIPQNAQVDSYLTIANFAVRGDKSREVMTGGGYMSYSTGIHKSRVVKIVSEKMPDQSAARDGFILYKVTPEAPMKAGEYALVLYTGEMRTAGFFAQASNSFFDFGVN
ncbi:MAG: hypothetical protein V4484_20990 [Pseudomonadota bacterium]